MNGYRQYNGLVGLTYTEPVVFEISSDTRDKYDDLLDLIYTVDLRTGFPSGAFQQFVSEGVSNDVKQFINDYLLGVNAERGMDVPDDVRQNLKDLPSDFIAQTARGRYESVDQYEARLTEYVKQLRTEEEFKQRYEKYNKILNASSKSD